MTALFPNQEIIFANSLDGHRDHVLVQRNSHRTRIQLLETLG